MLLIVTTIHVSYNIQLFDTLRLSFCDIDQQVISKYSPWRFPSIRSDLISPFIKSDRCRHVATIQSRESRKPQPSVSIFFGEDISNEFFELCLCPLQSLHFL